MPLIRQKLQYERENPMKRSRLAPISKNKANIALRLKKKKAVTITKLKAQLWQLCRQIIKNTYRRSDGSYQCYTCPQIMQDGQQQLHTGHFIMSSISSMEMRYSLENLRLQCANCNIWKSGNWIAFEAHLIRDGIDVEALKRRNQETKGLLYGKFWVEGKIREYTELLANQ